jgi:hypothetical protein
VATEEERKIMSTFQELDRVKIRETLHGVKVAFGAGGVHHLLIRTKQKGLFDLVTGYHYDEDAFADTVSVGDTAEFSDVLDDEDDEYTVSRFTGVIISSDGIVLFEDSQREQWRHIRPLTCARDIDVRQTQREVDRLTEDLDNARAKLEALQKQAQE